MYEQPSFQGIYRKPTRWQRVNKRRALLVLLFIVLLVALFVIAIALDVSIRNQKPPPAIDAAFLSLAKADHGGKLPSSAVRAEYLTGQNELISKCAESPTFLAFEIESATAKLAYDGITQSRLRTIKNAWPLIRAEKRRRNCETTFADYLLLGNVARTQRASTLMKAGCAAIGPWTAQLAALPAQTTPAMFQPLTGRTSPWYAVASLETASNKTVSNDGRAFVQATTGAETNGGPLALLESTVTLSMDCSQIKQSTGSVTFSGGAWVNLSSAGE